MYLYRLLPDYPFASPSLVSLHEDILVLLVTAFKYLLVVSYLGDFKSSVMNKTSEHLTFTSMHGYDGYNYDYDDK